jgi:hypothetical protein
MVRRPLQAKQSSLLQHQDVHCFVYLPSAGFRAQKQAPLRFDRDDSNSPPHGLFP